MVGRVRDLLDNPHTHAPEQAEGFIEVVRSQIAQKISELETRSAAEDHGVIQLFNAIALPEKPNLDDVPAQEKADACRQWLQDNANQLDTVTYIDVNDKNLTVVPREIGLFRNLQTLNLSENQIQSLQDTTLPASGWNLSTSAKTKSRACKT